MSSETPAAESSGSTKATSACVVGTLACRSTMARDHGHPTSSGRPAGFYGGSTTAVGGNQWYQQRLGTANEIAVVPAAEGPAWDPQPVQRFAGWQMGLLDEIDDLELFRCGIPHSCSSPSAIMLFLSRRFSSVRSATHSFSALASRRRYLTSSLMAARVVSPARRRLPASMNSFDQVTRSGLELDLDAILLPVR